MSFSLQTALPARAAAPATTSAKLGAKKAIRGLPALQKTAAVSVNSTGKRNVAVSCSADNETSPVARFGAGLAAMGMSASLMLGTPNMAQASEIEILGTPKLENGYIVDDAGLMSRATQTKINKVCNEIEKQTGFRLNVVTVRKLVFEQDPFAFSDKLLETWYPTLEEGNDKGILLLGKSSKEGAIVGGPKFLKTLGDDLLDSILSENIPILAEDEKFNEALTSSVDRMAAIFEGKSDPGPPTKFVGNKGSNYKTKEETGEKREIYANVLIGLLVISFIVPMIQYFGYVVGDVQD